jgi:hypothetical protein
MCLCWKVRQSRLGIDDFGHPLHPVILATDADSDVDVPGLITAEGDDPKRVKGALAAAIESAVEEDIRAEEGQRVAGPSPPEERTPLLPQSSVPNTRGRIRRWLGL